MDQPGKKVKKQNFKEIFRLLFYLHFASFYFDDDLLERRRNRQWFGKVCFAGRMQ